MLSGGTQRRDLSRFQNEKIKIIHYPDWNLNSQPPRFQH